MPQSASYRRSGRRHKRARVGMPLRIILVLVLIGILYLTASLFFRVQFVEVNGVQRYSAEEIKQVSGIEMGTSLIGLQSQRIGRALSDHFAYIETCRVHMRLPDTAVIEITECTAIAYIESQNARWVVSDSGKLLERRTTAIGDLPEIRGMLLEEPQVNSRIVCDERVKEDAYFALIESFTDRDILRDVEWIDIATVANVSFLYREVFTVRLGLVGDLDYKLDTLGYVVDELMKTPNVKGTIDLSDCVETRRARFYEEI